MEAWLSAVIAGGFTLAGALLGAWLGLKGASRVSREEREALERAEALRAFRLYVSATVHSVAELRQLPPVKPSRLADGTDRLVDLVGGEGTSQMATRARVRRRYGDRHLELADRLSAAYVEVSLRELPADVRAAVDAAIDYVERLSMQRSDELIAEWTEVHARLIAAGRELREGAVASHTPSHTLPTNDVGQPASEPGTAA